MPNRYPPLFVDYTKWSNQSRRAYAGALTQIPFSRAVNAELRPAAHQHTDADTYCTAVASNPYNLQFTAHVFPTLKSHSVVVARFTHPSPASTIPNRAPAVVVTADADPSEVAGAPQTLLHYLCEGFNKHTNEGDTGHIVRAAVVSVNETTPFTLTSPVLRPAFAPLVDEMRMIPGTDRDLVHARKHIACSVATSYLNDAVDPVDPVHVVIGAALTTKTTGHMHVFYAPPRAGQEPRNA